jgi:hypothetical protein
VVGLLIFSTFGLPLDVLFAVLQIGDLVRLSFLSSIPSMARLSLWSLRERYSVLVQLGCLEVLLVLAEFVEGVSLLAVCMSIF